MKKFVIAITRNQGHTYRFFAYDPTSGGYPYWTADINSAHLFPAKDDEQLVKEYQAILHTKDSVSSDGTIYPNTMKHSGLELCYARPIAHGRLEVMEVVLQSTDVSDPISGEIKKPIGFVY
jgi:hypothetical protein